MTNAEVVMLSMIRNATEHLRMVDRATHDEGCASRRVGEWGDQDSCDCGADEINEAIYEALSDLDMAHLVGGEK